MFACGEWRQRRLHADSRYGARVCICGLLLYLTIWLVGMAVCADAAMVSDGKVSFPCYDCEGNNVLVLESFLGQSPFEYDYLTVTSQSLGPVGSMLIIASSN